MTACCCIDVDEPYKFTDTTEIKRAGKGHLCVECRRVIPKGAPHRLEKCLDNGGRSAQWHTYRTCRTCSAMRDDRMSCGWYYGAIWDDLAACHEDAYWPGEDDGSGGELAGWLDPPTKPINPKTGF